MDELILRQRDTSDPKDGTLDETLYAMQDANFNVVALADSNGDVVERFVDDAYKGVVLLGPLGTSCRLRLETAETRPKTKTTQGRGKAKQN